jgi:hypothetical protein
MAKRAPADDLFAIFPDLPWLRYPPHPTHRRLIHARVEVVRDRALMSIARQRLATERIGFAVSARRRRR